MKYGTVEEKSTLFQGLINRIEQYYDNIESVYKEGVKSES